MHRLFLALEPGFEEPELLGRQTCRLVGMSRGMQFILNTDPDASIMILSGENESRICR